MNDPVKHPASPVYDRAARHLGTAVEGHWFNSQPVAQTLQLERRIKLTAKIVSSASGIGQSRALNAVAKAVKFQSWHHLSKHLDKATNLADGQPLPQGWLDALHAAALLTVEVEDEVALPGTMLESFETLGHTLSKLLDIQVAPLLDHTIAKLCGGKTWREVKERSPLAATKPLYGFSYYDARDSLTGDDVAGRRPLRGSFRESAACSQLENQLAELMEGFEDFDLSQKLQVRAWVESTLQAQPGFLAGGLAMATMQRDAGEPEALNTVDRYVKMYEALMPRGFKGQLRWGTLENRLPHRLLWLQMSLAHLHGSLEKATTAAQKMLRLNPSDNMGARYVLPLLLLQRANVAGAAKALKALEGEADLEAAAIRAFVCFAQGDEPRFRLQLARALFTLPILRVILLDDPEALPKSDDGYRGVQPDMEVFSEFAWPAYLSVPGLRAACTSFLQHPDVRHCEEELRLYWAKYWTGRRRQHEAVRFGSPEEWQRLVDACTIRAAQQPLS